MNTCLDEIIKLTENLPKNTNSNIHIAVIVKLLTWCNVYIDKIKDIEILLRFVNVCKRIQYTQNGGFNQQHAHIIGQYTIAKQLTMQIEMIIKGRYPEHYFHVNKVNLPDKDDQFIINESRNVDSLIRFIDMDRPTIKMKQDAIELIARIMFSMNLIDYKFKDRCYCVKDTEQYIRYIKILKELITKERIPKMNAYLIDRVREIVYKCPQLL